MRRTRQKEWKYIYFFLGCPSSSGRAFRVKYRRKKRDAPLAEQPTHRPYIEMCHFRMCFRPAPDKRPTASPPDRLPKAFFMRPEKRGTTTTTQPTNIISSPTTIQPGTICTHQETTRGAWNFDSLFFFGLLFLTCKRMMGCCPSGGGGSRGRRRTSRTPRHNLCALRDIPHTQFKGDEGACAGRTIHPPTTFHPQSAQPELSTYTCVHLNPVVLFVTSRI